MQTKWAWLSYAAARPIWFASWCNCLLPGHTLQQVSRQLIDSHTYLRHVVTLAYRHCRIVQCLEIDGDTVGRTDLILAAIAAANIRHVVILRDHQPFQPVVDTPGRGQQLLFVLLQRQHRDFDRCKGWVQAQHRARLFTGWVWLFLVSVDQQVKERA